MSARGDDALAQASDEPAEESSNLQPEAGSNAPNNKDGASKTMTSNSGTSGSPEASIQQRGPEVTEENPLVLSNVNIMGAPLRHGMLTVAEAEAGVRMIWLMKRIQEAS